MCCSTPVAALQFFLIHREFSCVKCARLLSQNQIREIVMDSDSDEDKYYASEDTKDEEDPRPPSRRTSISQPPSPDFSAFCVDRNCFADYHTNNNLHFSSVFRANTRNLDHNVSKRTWIFTSFFSPPRNNSSPLLHKDITAFEGTLGNVSFLTHKMLFVSQIYPAWFSEYSGFSKSMRNI